MWVRMWRMEKSSRPWAMHGQPPGRPPGPSTEYPSSCPSSCTLPISTEHYMPYGAHSLFWKSIRGWFYLQETRALGALKPTVSGIGLYLHKELGAAEIGILSTQRIFVRPRSGFHLHKEFRATGVRFYLHKHFMGPNRKRIFIEKNECYSQKCPCCARLFLRIHWEQWVSYDWHT